MRILLVVALALAGFQLDVDGNDVQAQSRANLDSVSSSHLPTPDVPRPPPPADAGDADSKPVEDTVPTAASEADTGPATTPKPATGSTGDAGATGGAGAVEIPREPAATSAPIEAAPDTPGADPPDEGPAQPAAAQSPRDGEPADDGVDAARPQPDQPAGGGAPADEQPGPNKPNPTVGHGAPDRLAEGPDAGGNPDAPAALAPPVSDLRLAPDPTNPEPPAAGAEATDAEGTEDGPAKPKGTGVLNILLLLSLIIAAFLTTHFIVRFAGRKWFLASPGLPYLVIGVLIGPAVFDIISASNLSKLQPAVMVGIGSIGLLAGLRLNFRRMRMLLEFEHLRSAGIIGTFTALAVGIPACLLLARYVGGQWVTFDELRSGDLSKLAILAPIAPPVLLIVATALVSGTTPIQYTVERYRAKGWMSTFAIYVAEFSEVLGILMFSLVFAIANNGATFFGFELDLLYWIIIQIGIGILFGFLFTWFIGGDDAKEKLLVALLGIIVFSSGVAYFLRLSPLLITFVVGLVLANFSGFAERIRVRLEAVEKPFFIVIFLFAGMQLVPSITWWSLVLIPAYAALRWGGKYLGGEVAFRTSPRGEHIIRGVGSALVSQGGLAVAMVLSYIQVVRSTPSVGSSLYQATMAPGFAESVEKGAAVADIPSLDLVGNVIDPAVSITSIVSTVIVASIIINDTFSFISTRNLLINAGEIDPDVDVVPEDIYAHPELNDMELVPPEAARGTTRATDAASGARQPE